MEATGPDGPLPVELAPAGEAGGQLSAAVTPLAVGKLVLAARYRGQHVGGSPWEAAVLPDVGAAASSSLLGLPAAFEAGRPTELTILVRDAHGNRTAGGDEVALEVESAAGVVSLPVADVGDGSYRATLAPTPAGLVTVSAKVNGELVGLPASLEVVPSTLASVAPLLAGRGPRLDAVAGRPLALAFAGMDAYGNRLTVGGGALKATVQQVR